MRIGCFGKLDQLDAIEKAGFDCAELDFVELVSLSEGQLSSLKEKIYRSRVTLDVFSGLLPMDVRIYDTAFDEKQWLKYIEYGAERAHKLGCRLIPFGAGKCRNIPQQGSGRKKYEEKLAEFIRRICDIFIKYQMVLAIEPLGIHYSNYLNTIEEAYEFARKTECENCKIMCDLRHMLSSGDTMENIAKYSNAICHAHIDYPFGKKRKFPQKKDGIDYAVYLETLKEIKYEGVLTIEATDYNNFMTESEKSCEYLKILMEEIERKEYSRQKR